jgi:hypothetical protein
VNGRAATAAIVALALLLLAGVVLVASELIEGSSRTVAIASPCEERAVFPGSGLDATIQRVVLDGLDGAACRLGTSRERLVLALAGNSSERLPAGQARTDAAVRAGLLRALDEAGSRGDIPTFLTPLLRRVVQRVPLEDVIRGAVGLRSLFG